VKWIFDSVIYSLKRFEVLQKIHIQLRHMDKEIRKFLNLSPSENFSWVSKFINAVNEIQQINTKYLEIGIGTGEIFEAISIESKMGVDGELESRKGQGFFGQVNILNLESLPKMDIVLINLPLLNPRKYADTFHMVKRCTHRNSLILAIDSIPYSLKHHLFSQLPSAIMLLPYSDKKFRSSKNATKIHDHQRYFLNFVEEYAKEINLVTLVDLDLAVCIFSLYDVDLGSFEEPTTATDIYRYFFASKFEMFSPQTSELYLSGFNLS
jgi:hypothetical protein